MNKIVILYHANCPDGFGAAWVAWKKFGNKAEYVAVEPRVLPKQKLLEKEIYVLDNSYPIEIQKKLREKNRKVVMIDHHVSSAPDVQAFPENVFDNNRSGAVLSWQYFFSKEKTPVLLRYIEDGDLWKFKLPSAHAILAYVHAHDFDFRVWNKLHEELENAAGKATAREKGNAILQYRNMLVNEVVLKARLVHFENREVFAVNTSVKKITSFVGRTLCQQKPPFSIVWYEAKDGTRHVSLRSDGDYDVSAIAKKYGGGGHIGSAGFVLPADKPFPWKASKK